MQPDDGKPQDIESSSWAAERLDGVLQELARRDLAGPSPDADSFIRRLRIKIGEHRPSRLGWLRGWRRAALIPMVGGLGWLAHVAMREPAIPASDVAIVDELDFLMEIEALPPENVPALDVDLVETVESLEILDGIALEWLEGSS